MGNFYTDVEIGGVGGAGTQADPYRSWQEMVDNIVSLAGGTNYYYVKGTEVLTTKVSMPAITVTTANNFQVVGVNDSWVEDGTQAVANANSTVNYGIDQVGASNNGVFKNISCINATLTGFDLNTASYGSTFYNCNFQNNGSHGLKGNGYSMKACNCSFIGNKYGAYKIDLYNCLVALNSTYGNYYGTAEKCLMINNQYANITTNYTRIINNVIDNNYAGIYGGGSGAIFEMNRITNNTIGVNLTNSCTAYSNYFYGNDNHIKYNGQIYAEMAPDVVMASDGYVDSANDNYTLTDDAEGRRSSDSEAIELNADTKYFWTAGMSGADYKAPTPIINSVVPNCGSTLGGTTVQIESLLAGFLASGNVITINGVAPASVVSESTTVVEVITEAGTGQGNIEVNGIIAVDGFSYTLIPSAPHAPVLDVDVISASRTTPKWTFESFVDYYKLYRDDILIADNINTTSYNDSGLNTGQEYTYKVEAVNDSGFTASNEVIVSTLSQDTPIESRMLLKMQELIAGMRVTDGYFFDWGTSDIRDNAKAVFPMAIVDFDDNAEDNIDSTGGADPNSYRNVAHITITSKNMLSTATPPDIYKEPKELWKAVGFKMLTDLKKLFGIYYYLGEGVGVETIMYTGYSLEEVSSNDVKRPYNLTTGWEVTYSQDRRNPLIATC